MNNDEGTSGFWAEFFGFLSKVSARVSDDDILILVWIIAGVLVLAIVARHGFPLALALYDTKRRNDREDKKLQHSLDRRAEKDRLSRERRLQGKKR